MKYLVLVILLFSPAVSSAQGREEAYDTRYTTVRYGSVEDFGSLEKNLKGGMGIFFKAHGPGSRYLANVIDGLFEKVEFLLDMYPRGVKVRVEVCEDRSGVEKAYWALGVRGDVPDAFFNSKTKVIYVNAQGVNIGVMAHEFAHAVICAYFNNTAPERTQEILAQYVDEQIKDSY